MAFQADFYDGISPRAKSVTVRVNTQAKQITVEIATNDITVQALTYNIAECDIQAKLGGIKRLIDLPDGGRLEATDINELETAMPAKTNVFWRGLYYVENHLGWIFASLVLTVIVGWAFLQFGVPVIAEKVAKATPPEMEAKMGEQVLNGLDSKYGAFTTSKIAAARKASLAKSLGEFCSAIQNCPHYRLEFRDAGEIKNGGIGPNAFALPGGIMVVTDQIVRLSKNDTELVAVIAHELGHVKGRHAFRQSIQGALSGLILAAITGDVSSVASGLPAALMQMRYTRELETEADNFALTALQKACLPPQAFADILQRLEDEVRGLRNKPTSIAIGDSKNKKTSKPIEKPAEKSANSEPNAMSQMLSTHPDTHARIQPFIKAKQTCQ
jgi:Peptidase family M48